MKWRMGPFDLIQTVTANGISEFVKRSNEPFVLKSDVAKAEYGAQVIWTHYII